MNMQLIRKPTPSELIKEVQQVFRPQSVGVEAFNTLEKGGDIVALTESLNAANALLGNSNLEAWKRYIDTLLPKEFKDSKAKIKALIVALYCNSCLIWWYSRNTLPLNQKLLAELALRIEQGSKMPAQSVDALLHGTKVKKLLLSDRKQIKSNIGVLGTAREPKAIQIVSCPTYLCQTANPLPFKQVNLKRGRSEEEHKALISRVSKQELFKLIEPLQEIINFYQTHKGTDAVCDFDNGAAKGIMITFGSIRKLLPPNLSERQYRKAVTQYTDLEGKLFEVMHMPRSTNKKIVHKSLKYPLVHTLERTYWKNGQSQITGILFNDILLEFSNDFKQMPLMRELNENFSGVIKEHHRRAYLLCTSLGQLKVKRSEDKLLEACGIEKDDNQNYKPKLDSVFDYWRETGLMKKITDLGGGEYELEANGNFLKSLR
ncbi:MAG: hypothetical protein QNL04_04465 [SAR324 cluster bacterium]|nr:hypothetical protein [SAR324 cluster bacterium]